MLDCSCRHRHNNAQVFSSTDDLVNTPAVVVPPTASNQSVVEDGVKTKPTFVEPTKEARTPNDSQSLSTSFDISVHSEPLALFRSNSMDKLMTAVRKPSADTITTTHSTIHDVLQTCIKPKYEYNLQVDSNQDDRATEIKLFSFQRPHMRAFHVSWICFFAAFCSWFAIPPLMPTIAKSLKMNAYQIYVSNIISVLATIFARFICGPLSARYGARTVMVWCLILASIPTFLVGTVTSFQGLCVVRFFIGIIGSSFIMCQV